MQDITSAQGMIGHPVCISQANVRGIYLILQGM